MDKWMEREKEKEISYKAFVEIKREGEKDGMFDKRKCI